MAEPRTRTERFERQAVARLLGLEFESRSPGAARVALPVRDDHLQPDGVVHGGILVTLADTAAVYAVYPDLPGEASITSIELKLNFLRPARPGRGPVVALARALKVGRTIATCEVELRQADEPLAKGLFTYLVLAAPPA